MGLMNEYINRKMGSNQLEAELLRLIGEYNQLQNTFLIVYVAAIGKQIPDIALSMDDYFIIFDLLKDKDLKNIDFYIESPGGSGEAAEELIRFIRSEFKDVHLSFIISGEAKSAATLLVLGGNDILMTKSGSLGPIDAQMKIGRTNISVYDYSQWIEERRKEAEEMKSLNPFDAVMIAQISPGEIKGVTNALKFAEDLVIQWLCKYKFKNWNFTETHKKEVTLEMKKARAREIANDLIDHEKWRSHGRSIKIDDLINNLHLKIIEIDNNPKLADCVYRIQTVIRMFFSSTNSYKIFATEKEKIFKQSVSRKDTILKIPVQKPIVTEVNINCSKCGKKHKLYAKFDPDTRIDQDYQKKGLKPFPKNNKLICECGFEYDISGLRNEIENKVGKKIVL